ncbi:hypothetical protein LQW54_005796 [Pestalotiopsis sp. IQ-011]
MAAESSKMSSITPKGLCPSGIFQAKKADLVEENAERGLAVDGKSDSELRLDRCMYEIDLQEERRDPARKKLVPLMKETKGQLFQYLKTLGSGAEFDDEVNQLGIQKYKPPVLASILRQFKGATASEFENLPAYESSKGGRKEKESSQSNSDTGGGEGSGGGKGSGGSGAESVMYELADKVDEYWAGLKSDEKLAMVRGYYADQGIQLAEDLALDDADDIWASLDPYDKVNVFMPALLPNQSQKTSGKGKKKEQEKDAKKKNKKQARLGEGKGKGRKDRSLSSVSESLHRNSPLDDKVDPEEMVERARRAQATLEEQAPRPGTKRPSSRAVARARLASVSKYLDAAEEERLLVSHDVDRLVVGAAKRYRAAQLSSIAKEEEEEEEDDDDDEEEDDDDTEEQIQNMEEARTALRDIAEDLGESIIEALGIYADAVLVLRNV